MEINLENLRWRENSPLIWQRDLDEVEHFWAHVARLHDSGGRQPFEITGHLSLDFETYAATSEDATRQVDSALKNAWTVVRHHHPTIASKIEYDHDTERFYKTYCSIRDARERQSWLESTLLQASGFESGVDFANSDPISPDIPTLFVINRSIMCDGEGVYKAGRDIVLRASHSTIDGAGTLLLLGNILRHVSKAFEQGSKYQLPPLNGSEVANLSPPYRIAANISPLASPDLQQRIDRMYSEHIHFGPNAGSGHLPPLGIPFKNEQVQVPSKHQRVEITIPKLVTSKILEACKTIGYTVTHLFHAAIPIAMRDLQKKSSEEKRFHYVFDLLCNERPFCSNPFNTADHAVAAYHSGSSKGSRVEIVLPAISATSPSLEERKAEYSHVVFKIRDLYVFVKEDKDQGQLAPYIWTGLIKGLPKVPRLPPPGPPPRESPTVTISSLGKVDAIIPGKIGRVRASKPWVTGEEMSNQYGLFLITHEGELSLAAAYNAAWHDKDDALDFLYRCRNIVLEVLDISE
jgi:hypothetical protein